MICDNCKQLQATLHVVKIVNGAKQERHLCAKCAAEQGSVMPFYMGDIFTPTTEQLCCSVCGMTPAHLKQTGKVGCALCYVDLRDELLPILRRVHGRIRHVGRRPLQYEGAEYETRKKVEALQADLIAAVEMERYEKAAQLRDEIKQLKGEMQ